MCATPINTCTPTCSSQSGDCRAGSCVPVTFLQITILQRFRVASNLCEKLHVALKRCGTPCQGRVAVAWTNWESFALGAAAQQNATCWAAWHGLRFLCFVLSKRHFQACLAVMPVLKALMVVAHLLAHQSGAQRPDVTLCRDDSPHRDPDVGAQPR